MRGRSVVVLWLGLALLAVGGADATARARSGTGDDPDRNAFFEKSIRPLLVEKCQKCHGGKKTRGGLRLTSRKSVLEGGDSGPVAVPGKPRESLIIEAVERRGELKMPPDGKLSPVEIDRLKRWIELDMPWPDVGSSVSVAAADRDASQSWWSFQPVRVAAPPAVKDKAWPRTEVDRNILAGLEARGLTPARPADRRTLHPPRDV